MGKSHILWKMEDEADETERLIIYRDLEGIRTPLEFAETVLHDVEAFLSRLGKLAVRARRLHGAIGGIEVGGLIKLPPDAAPHWKKLLTDTLDDLAEHESRPMVFFWDELPLMLQNVRAEEGEAAAMEVLDVLRQIRQTYPGVRMVFTGSIGLHNVLSALKAAGHANSSVNDMRMLVVPPLEPEYATELAQCLIDGENVETTDPGGVANALAKAVDNIAFYIHYVVDELAELGESVDTETVESVVHACLIDPQDSWHMAHYRERLDTYYDPEQLELALALLDVLAHDSPLTFEVLFDHVKTRLDIPDDDAERVHSMLTLLQRDHYLKLDEDGGYSFLFPLIQRWWALHRN